MAAQPEYGTMTFVGRSGTTYIKDIYVSDVDDAALRFDSGGGASATSETEWIPPENVILRDFSVVTGTQDTEKLRITRQGVPTGDILRYSIHLTTLAYRPVLRIPFLRGQKVGAIQSAD
jgi:hypothetical protein